MDSTDWREDYFTFTEFFFDFLFLRYTCKGCCFSIKLYFSYVFAFSTTKLTASPTSIIIDEIRR